MQVPAQILRVAVAPHLKLLRTKQYPTIRLKTFEMDLHVLQISSHENNQYMCVCVRVSKKTKFSYDQKETSNIKNKDESIIKFFQYTWINESAFRDLYCRAANVCSIDE